MAVIELNKIMTRGCRFCGGDKLLVCSCLHCYMDKRKQIEDLIVSKLCVICKLKLSMTKKEIIKIEGIKELEYLI